MVEPLTGGIIGITMLLALLFLGVPICVCLILSSLVGLFLIEGASGAFMAVGPVALKQMWSAGLLAIPVFIFMGNLISRLGLGSDLYDTIYKWLGWLPGGLAIASTVVSALFGFMCGSGLAGTATIGGVALPEMERSGYDRRLALGTLALGGGLSALIPPSVLMILYATQTESSTGWLFIAGIFPGFLLTALMSLYIFTRCTLNPKLGPRGAVLPIGEKVKSLVHLIPVIVMFVVVLGGIYMGIWAPMEAGGGGCFIAILIAISYRRLSWTRVRAAALGAGKTTVMIYLLLIGAGILSLMFYVSGLNEVIKEAFVGLGIPGWGVLVIMLLLLTIMGCFIDVMGMLLITIPIFLPIILALGYDPVWFGIIMVVSCEMAMITPPIGLHLFVIQGIAPKGTTLMDAAIGAAPFVGVLWVLLGLLIAFPDIALWLPSTMIQ